MKISDKAIGYFSFVAILFILAGVAFGMWNAHKESSTTAVIDFDELGALSPEDPMTENGYLIGHVGSIEWLGDRSRVTVVFDNPVTLREGTQFRNASYALMGQRRVELVRNKDGEVLPKDYIFRGEFVPGITESLRFISDLYQQVMLSRDAILTILNGSDTSSGVVQKYQTALQNVENLLQHFDKTATLAQDKIQSLLAQAETASETINRTADATDSLVQIATLKADSAIRHTQSALADISLGLEKIDAIARKVQEDSLAKNLLETKDLIEKVSQLSQKLTAVIQGINPKDIAVYDEKGNRIKLITWKNMHIWGGKARDKHK